MQGLKKIVLEPRNQRIAWLNALVNRPAVDACKVFLQTHDVHISLIWKTAFACTPPWGEVARIAAMFH